MLTTHYDPTPMLLGLNAGGWSAVAHLGARHLVRHCHPLFEITMPGFCRVRLSGGRWDRRTITGRVMPVVKIDLDGKEVGRGARADQAQNEGAGGDCDRALESGALDDGVGSATAQPREQDRRKNHLGPFPHLGPPSLFLSPNPQGSPMKQWFGQEGTASGLHRGLSQEGPDVATGYGLIDATSTAAIVQQDHLSGKWSRMRYGFLRDQAHRFLVEIDQPKEFKVTLAWTDTTGTPNQGGLDDRAPALVDDLDLLVISPSGVREYPYRLDAWNPGSRVNRRGPNSRDNVEQVLLRNAEIGTYLVVVRFTNYSVREWGQYYSLVLSHAAADFGLDHVKGRATSESPARDATPYLVAPRR